MAKLSFYTGGRASPQQAPTRSPQWLLPAGGDERLRDSSKQEPPAAPPAPAGQKTQRGAGPGAPPLPDPPLLLDLSCQRQIVIVFRVRHRITRSTRGSSPTWSVLSRPARAAGRSPAPSLQMTTQARVLGPCTYIYTHSSSNSTYHCSRV